MCRVVVTERTNTSSVMAVVLCGASPPRLLREREEKFNESRERALSEKGKREDDKHSRRHITNERTERKDKKRKKRNSPFRAFSRASSFLSAFRPQDALVFHRKHKRSIGQKSAERRKRQKASLYSSEFEIRRTARAHYKPPLAHA